MKINFQNYWPFIKYTLVGTVGLMIDIGWLYVFIEFLAWPLLTATTLAFLLSTTVGFVLHKWWTFHNHSKHYRELYLKFFLVSVVGLALTNGFMYIFVALLGLWYILAKILTALLILAWSFLSNKYWTFKKKRFLFISW